MCIYENKGDAGGFGNYKPIHRKQTIYKIWHGLIARKLNRIMHILTRCNQFAHKEGISTIYAITQIEQYIEHADRDAGIARREIANEFGAINRTLLWKALYKKGIHGEMIKRIRRGSRETKLPPKYKWGRWRATWVQYRSISRISNKCATTRNIWL